MPRRLAELARKPLCLVREPVNRSEMAKRLSVLQGQLKSTGTQTLLAYVQPIQPQNYSRTRLRGCAYTSVLEAQCSKYLLSVAA